MSSVKRIHISDLSEVTVTRARGAEAFDRLAPQLSPDLMLELDLDGVDLLSPSFLDELILKLSKADAIEQVVFLTKDLVVLQKLRRAATYRRVALLVKSGDVSTRRLEERASPALVTSVGSKPALGDWCFLQG